MRVNATVAQRKSVPEHNYQSKSSETRENREKRLGAAQNFVAYFAASFAAWRRKYEKMRI